MPARLQLEVARHIETTAGVLSKMEPAAPKDDVLRTHTEANVRYVLSGQPTGWAAMASQVREFDEEKVKDTKEDIDTLLVFAGLFSAVLTAFLVESYQRLLPDTASQMLTTSAQTLEVMQQISLQLSNSTYQPLLIIPDTTSSPFEPSSTDIRVNVLWFASLIFSLMTASFGMLVKQWLREFLAVETPSPHARLRIRHYRYPELLRWDVFEIAAVLPLLQQLALALFFVGLCYFTASVHESVGNTSLPLVTGWAFCFLATTLLPVFAPRCPYRTTLLRSLHVHIVRLLEGSDRWASSSMPLRRRFQWLWGFYISLTHHLSKHDEQMIITRDGNDLKILADVDALQSNDELLCTTIFEALQQIHEPSWNGLIQFVLQVLGHRLSSPTLASEAPRPLNLYSLSRPAYEGVINILSYSSRLHILRHRRSGLRRQSFRANMSAFYIFFSPSRFPIPESGANIIPELLEDSGPDTIHKLVLDCLRSSDSKTRLCDFVLGVKQRAEELHWDGRLYLWSLESIADAVFEDSRVRLDMCLPANQFVLQGDVAAWPWNSHTWPSGRVCCTIIELAGDAIHEALRFQETTVDGDNSDESTSTNRIAGALVAMFHLADLANAKSWTIAPHVRAAIHDFLSHKRGVLCLFTALDQIPAPVVSRVCLEVGTWHTTADLSTTLIQNLLDALDELGMDCGPENGPIGASFLLKIAALAVHLVQPPDALRGAELWGAVFTSLSRLLRQSLSISNPVSMSFGDPPSAPPTTIELYRAVSSSRDLSTLGMLAETSLQGVQKEDSRLLDNSNTNSIPPQTYEHWLPIAGDEETVFHDDFVEMLGMIYMASQHRDSSDPEGTRFWRLRRLGLARHLSYAVSLP